MRAILYQYHLKRN